MSCIWVNLYENEYYQYLRSQHNEVNMESVSWFSKIGSFLIYTFFCHILNSAFSKPTSITFKILNTFPYSILVGLLHFCQFIFDWLAEIHKTSQNISEPLWTVQIFVKLITSLNEINTFSFFSFKQSILESLKTVV